MERPYDMMENMKSKISPDNMEALKRIAKNISTLAQRTIIVGGIPALRIVCNAVISYLLIYVIKGLFIAGNVSIII